MGNSEIKIISKSSSEIFTAVMHNENNYLVSTENNWPRNTVILTRVRLGGKILSSVKTDCKDLHDVPDVQEKLAELMRTQHETAVNALRSEQAVAEKTLAEQMVKTKARNDMAEKTRKTIQPEEYINSVKTLLARKNYKNALNLLNDALEHHPRNSFLISYYGCLDAIVNKNFRSGIDMCNHAIRTLREALPFGNEIFYPVLFLNLGKAYLAAGKRKNGVEALYKGLRFDNDNREILKELKRIGIRKKTPLPFLSRSNPLNKYLGIMFCKKSSRKGSGHF